MNNFETTKKAAVKVVWIEHFEDCSDDELKKILTYNLRCYHKSPYRRLPKLAPNEIRELIAIEQIRRNRNARKRRADCESETDDEPELYKPKRQKTQAVEIELDDEV